MPQLKKNIGQTKKRSIEQSSQYCNISFPDITKDKLNKNRAAEFLVSMAFKLSSTIQETNLSRCCNGGKKAL